MNYLKNLAEQDFVSNKTDNNVEVLVKKLYEPLMSGNDINKSEYICIRKDFLLIMNDMFNNTEQKLNQYKEIVDKMKNVMEELNEQ